MNIFEQYGIKEVADVTLYAIELDENDDEIYVPVLYMDTLKVSTVEESTQQTSAQGGQGNPKLITWDYGKDIVVNLEDALFSPASSSMTWGGKLGAKGLQLYLRYFFDRNTDNGVPDICPRMAMLTVENFSDFLVIPDRWPEYEGIQCEKNTEHAGYVGGTSIFCWMVSGNIASTDGKKKVQFEKLILFYREITQKWYFFNGYEYKDLFDVNKPEHYGIGYQYGEDAFNWIRENIANVKGEWEKIADITLDEWGMREEYLGSDERPHYPVPFLTQNLYLDGYRKGCAKHEKYSNFAKYPFEMAAIDAGEYLPYRYFANIGVEYNTNVAPPTECIYQIDTALDDCYYIDETIKYVAEATFCIDADENMKHAQYRYLRQYDATALTVFINPRTMEPYQPNAYEFYRQNGQRLTGNLTIIRKGDIYYKWTRRKAKGNRSLGKEIVIDPTHYPGTYRLVGRTYIRDRLKKDDMYQFEIPLCKLTAVNKLNLQADGEPTVFNMKLTALRRQDGVMMKLTHYTLLDYNDLMGIPEGTAPERLVPEEEIGAIRVPEFKPYDGEKDPHLSLTIDAHTPRDYAAAMLSDDVGLYKHTEFVPNPEDEGEEKSRVIARITGDVDVFSIDETKRSNERFRDYVVPTDHFDATIEGNDPPHEDERSDER